MTEHYVRYASLGANLQPPLTEYDLVTALTSHFPMEIQRAMLAAKVRTSQEALAFLGRMQSLENSVEVYKKARQEQSSRDFERHQPKRRETGGSSDYRETPRDVRHVQYEYRQGNSEFPRERGAPFRRRNYQPDRRDARQPHDLNPHLPEFEPRNAYERQRAEQVAMHTGRPGTNHPNQENC